ncbi:MIT C-terminal domain-containing protein [Rhodococcus sp. NPDC054953]
MGYSFEGLLILIPHLRGATRIEIVDPYIRAPHQLRNLYELLVEIIAAKPGRGLDVFQPFESAGRYDIRSRRQDRRRMKACTITYLKGEQSV